MPEVLEAEFVNPLESDYASAGRAFGHNRRLKAARSNLRFQDRRIADLEARVTESATPTTQASIADPKRPQALSHDTDLTSNQIN